MIGKAKGQGTRGGARPNSGRPKGSKNKPKKIMGIAQIVQERRGGKRAGAGKKENKLNNKEMQKLSDAVIRIENKFGIGIIEQVLSLLYDPDTSSSAKASIFKTYLDALNRAGKNDVKAEEEKVITPVIGLPEIRRVQ